MSEENKKTKTIAFRVSEKTFARIEKAAASTGKTPNDWCRDLIETETESEELFSPNERIIFEELAKLRYLVGIGFGLLSTDELNAGSWGETKRQVDNFGEKIAAQILARRREKS